MYKRSLSPYIQLLAKKFPVITILGPRQSGKTTLVKSTFPELSYVNLEDYENRALALSDSKSFISKFPNGAIFDEIQRVPSLLSAIQVKVDEDERKGLFILTGSHQVDLHHSISQSLAGRTSLVKLLPLSLEELRQNQIHLPMDTVILNGGYPRIYKDELPIDNAYSSYIQTYLERDVRNILNIKDALLFEKFLKLVASRVGQIVNYSSLAVDVGVSAVTIKEWISVLESTYIIFRLQPYYENFGKRMIKSPKIYFTDTGLLSYLLGIEHTTQLQSESLYGNIFENFVILEILKHYFNLAKDQKLYFYRDHQGNEIDLLIQKGSYLIPLEIKSSKTFSTFYLKGLNFFHELLNKKSQSGYVIYQGTASQKIKQYNLISIENLSELFLYLC